MNHTDLDGCTCFSNPPCSYCVDTFECEVCKDRKYAEDSVETIIGIICTDCADKIEIDY